MGDVVVPLHPDGWFQLTLTHPNLPPLSSSLGLLVAAGEAGAALVLPPGTAPSLAGLRAHHAYFAIGPALLAAVVASNAIPVDLLP